MKGVYIIDLEDDKGFICVANDLTAAKEMTHLHREMYSIEGNIEGSFHYFPLIAFESDTDAEIRVYKRMKKHMGNTTFYCSKATMETLAKGTWDTKRASSMPLIGMAYKNTPSSDQIFKMSMD